MAKVIITCLKNFRHRTDFLHGSMDGVCVCDVADAAEQLGANLKLVERLVEWCEAKDHAGVMGESNRLLSALIRHSKSKVKAVHTLPFHEKFRDSGNLIVFGCFLALNRKWYGRSFSVGV